MWLDFGIYLEYKITDDRDDPDILEFKPLFEKKLRAGRGHAQPDLRERSGRELGSRP